MAKGTPLKYPSGGSEGGDEMSAANGNQFTPTTLVDDIENSSASSTTQNARRIAARRKTAGKKAPCGSCLPRTIDDSEPTGLVDSASRGSQDPPDRAAARPRVSDTDAGPPAVRNVSITSPGAATPAVLPPRRSFRRGSKRDSSDSCSSLPAAPPHRATRRTSHLESDDVPAGPSLTSVSFQAPRDATRSSIDSSVTTSTFRATDNAPFPRGPRLNRSLDFPQYNAGPRSAGQGGVFSTGSSLDGTDLQVHQINDVLESLLKSVEASITSRRESAVSVSLSGKSVTDPNAGTSRPLHSGPHDEEYDADVESIVDSDLVRGVTLAKMSMEAFKRYSKKVNMGSALSGHVSEDSRGKKNFERKLSDIQTSGSEFGSMDQKKNEEEMKERLEETLTEIEKEFKNKLIELLNKELYSYYNTLQNSRPSPGLEDEDREVQRKKEEDEEVDDDVNGPVNNLPLTGNRKKKLRKRRTSRGNSCEDCYCVDSRGPRTSTDVTPPPAPQQPEYPLDRYLSEETRATLQGRAQPPRSTALQRLRAEAAATVRSADETSQRAEEVGREAERCLAAIREATERFRDSSRGASTAVTGNDASATGRTSSTTVPSTTPSRSSRAVQQTVPNKAMQDSTTSALEDDLTGATRPQLPVRSWRSHQALRPADEREEYPSAANARYGMPTRRASYNNVQDAFRGSYDSSTARGSSSRPPGYGRRSSESSPFRRDTPLR